MTHPTVYPQPRYRGDTGEVSAPCGAGPRARPHPRVRRRRALPRDRDVDGRGVRLYRWDMGAIPSGPEAHFHASISESFFVLSGTVRLYDGSTWIDGRAGDFLYVPPGGIHAFRNESGELASMLILFTPGAPREDYFETLARKGLQDMSEAEKAEFFLRHDTFWTGS